MYDTWHTYLISMLWNLSFALLLSLTLLPSATLAQDPVPRIKHFTTKDGLSQATVNDLLRDGLGFVWIATEDGLNRFDGKEFKHFKHNETDSTSISGNVLNKLCEDENGNIWVGTIGNGLNYYDKDLNTFKKIRLHPAGEKETISDILVVDDIIWVSTRASGLYRLQSREDGSFLKQNYLSDRRLGAISIDMDNTLWVGSFSGEVYTLASFDNRSFQVKKELQVEGYIQDLYHTEKKLLIGCDFGLYIYDKQKQRVDLFEPEKENGHPTKHVVTFLRENGSKVWIGTGNGMYLLNLSNMEIEQKVAYTENSTGGLTTSTVQSLLRVSTNRILVGTSSFLNLLDFSEPYFKNISKNKLGHQLLNDNVVYSVLKDGHNLWIGTADGGLNLIKDRKTYYFLEDNDRQSISGSAVLDMAKDHKNNRLWLATTRGLGMINLESFDPDNPRFAVYQHDPDNPHSISMDYVTSVTLDNDNNLWGGTYGNGIFRLETSMEDGPRFIRYKSEVGNSNSLANNFISCIRADNQNTIWVGSEGGLAELKFLSDNYLQPYFTNHSRNASNKKSLSNNTVVDILIDAGQRIWIGTRNGLNLFLEDNGFKSWTEQKQFPNALVYNLQDDEAGNLWLGTNDGIVLFDPKNEAFKRYGPEDGIQGTEFNIGTSFRDDDGVIYLGGVNGLTYFHPGDLEKIDIPRPLHFSQLRIKDEIVDTQNTAEDLLKKPLWQTHQLKFRYNQFPFYLRFSSIDFRLDKNVEYGYKLLSTDGKWNMLTDTEIQFLNLPSGKHTLLVNGFSRGKQWNQMPLKMELSVLPPWWATWWAYVSYVLLAATLAHWFYRFQLSRKLAVSESLRLKEVNQLKNSLYTNITHEFRTPLTVILGMAETAKSDIENQRLKTAGESLEMIQRNGKNLLKLVNEMLDLAKLESGSMELQLIVSDVIPFIKYICESFQSATKESEIDFMVYSEVEELTMDLDPQKLSAVVVNLLSNAIKYTLPGGKILVHLNKIKKNNKAYFLFKVKDDGMGISEEDIPLIFDRFYQVDGSSSRKGEGTGIGLALVKEFVQLMDGSINVISRPGHGSEFVVEIPVTTSAPSEQIKSPQERPESYPKPQLHTIQNTIAEEEDVGLPIVLLIEDNMDVAHYLKACLKGKYLTLHAGNGSKGIEMAFEKIPDIIICDVMMPGKDGYEVCSTLKTDERTDHIPIIMLTAKATLEDRITGLSRGADAYLAKPFNKQELFTRLDQLVLLRKRMIQKLEKEGFSSFLKKKTENPETKFLQKAMTLVQGEMGNHSFGSQQLAQKLYMSESQVYRKLKAITGKSTAIFIRSVRLRKARQLIRTTHRSISEIAYDVGFNDPSWFSRAFREEFGHSPSEVDNRLF